MKPRYHALLIGIDAYTGPEPLEGCVNDVDAIQRILLRGLDVPVADIKRLVAPRTGAVHDTDVPGALPTLANILAALDFLESDQVSPADRVFIYFSGHGTQLGLPGAKAKFVREALLPTDHRGVTSRRHLFDWELNARLGRIADRTKNVTVVIDACCSSGATRNIAPASSGSSKARIHRSVPFMLTEEEAVGFTADRGGITRRLTGSVRDCQVVAACLDDEQARESIQPGDARRHGELTRALAGRLANISREELAELRWGRIWREVLADVELRNPSQHPWMHGSMARHVFGGPPTDADAGYRLELSGNEYRIGAGTLSGVTEDAVVGVYGSEPLVFPELGSPKDQQARKGELKVVRADTSSAFASQNGVKLPEGARGRLVASGKNARLRVALDPVDPALSAELSASPFVEIVAERPQMILVKRGDGAWVITDDVFRSGQDPRDPVLVVIPPAARDKMRAVVEHYYRYSQALRFAERCTEHSGLLGIEVFSCNGLGKRVDPAKAQALDLQQLESPPTLNPTDRVAFGVENRGKVTLRVTLIGVGSSGRVDILGSQNIQPGFKHGFWGNEAIGTPFMLDLSPGHDVVAEQFVAIGTTDFRATLDHLKVGESFAEILEPTRGTLVAARGRTEPIWTAARMVVRVER